MSGSNPKSYAKALNLSTLDEYLHPVYELDRGTWNESKEVHVGDVGVYRDGIFFRLYNVLGAVAGHYTPEGSELLKLDLAKDIHKREIFKAGDGKVWLSPQLRCKRLESSSEVMRYEIEKKSDDKWAYALFCPREAIEFSIDKTKLNELKPYVERNIDHWKADLEDKGITSSEVALVVGCVKTSQWARLELKTRGVYTFEIDPESTGSAVLKLDDHTIVGYEEVDKAIVAGCADRSEAAFNGVQRAWRERGLTPRVHEYKRSYCLFLSYLKVEKDWRGNPEIRLATREKKSRWLPGIA